MKWKQYNSLNDLNQINKDFDVKFTQNFKLVRALVYLYKGTFYHKTKSSWPRN